MKNIHSLLIFLSGGLTILLNYIFEKEGGGVSLILVLSIPLFLVLSSLFSALWYYIIYPKSSRKIRYFFLLITYSILIIGAVLFFPFKT